MSEVKQDNVLRYNGKEYPFTVNERRGCCFAKGCIHELSDGSCSINDMLYDLGMTCATESNFYQPKPKPRTLADDVAEWLGNGEYVVETHDNDRVGLWHGDQYECIDGNWITNTSRWSDEKLLHHGDAISTIQWLCEQGYEVEYTTPGGNHRIAVKTNGTTWTIKNANGSDQRTIYVDLAYDGQLTITRFYRAPAESDAQKIERLLREGFTVECRDSEGNLYIYTCASGEQARYDFIKTGGYRHTRTIHINDIAKALTYLAHYREPEPDEVLRAMDELEAIDRQSYFGSPSYRNVQACYERLSDYYAIARWNIITSNPENNVTD